MDFKTQLLTDDRLLSTNEITYNVCKGGENIQYSRQPVVADSTSNLVYNITVPSLETTIDRRVLFGANVVLRVQGIPAAGAYLVNFGTTDALAPFPLHQMSNTHTATINSSSVSANIPDLLPAVLKLFDKRSLNKYNGGCPTLLDSTFNYDSAVNFYNSPLGGYDYSGSLDTAFIPNGAHPVVIGNTFSNGVVSGAQVVGDGTTTQTTFIQFDSIEPFLCLSPFTYSVEDTNSVGIYGVQNLNFQLSMLGNCARALRSSNTLARTVVPVAITNSYLDLIFINRHPSQVVPAKNVIPYMALDRYISSSQPTVPTGSSATIRSASLQLNQISDKLIIFARSRGDANRQVPDRFLVIDSCVITFNSSTQLSGASSHQLWKMSKEAGSNQTWQEWSGVVSDSAGPATPTQKPMSGSMLMLDMGRHLALTQDYLAAGSIGQYNLQVQLTVHTQGGADVSDVDLVIITANSGIVVCESGVASIFTGILTKEDVLKASEQEPTGWAHNNRMVGSGFLDRLKTVATKIVKVAKPFLEGSKAGEFVKSVGGGKKVHHRLM
jgi:hypothetical protein